MNIATRIAGVLLSLLGVLLSLLAASLPAHAGKDADRAFDRHPPVGERRPGDRPDARDGRHGDDAQTRRLSPDERRDLRRDIRDAGREIYDRDRRRGREGG